MIKIIRLLLGSFKILILNIKQFFLQFNSQLTFQNKTQFQLCDSESSNNKEVVEINHQSSNNHSDESTPSSSAQPRSNGSKSVYSAPLSQIGSCSNLQNGNNSTQLGNLN